VFRPLLIHQSDDLGRKRMTRIRRVVRVARDIRQVDLVRFLRERELDRSGQDKQYGKGEQGDGGASKHGGYITHCNGVWQAVAETAGRGYLTLGD